MGSSGTARLAQVLLSVEDGQPTQRLVDLLLDLVVDAEFSAEGAHAVQNTDVADVLFALLPHCPAPLAEYVLDAFQALVSGSVADAIVCARSTLPEVLRTLLACHGVATTLGEKALTLLFALARHHTQLEDFAGLLSLLEAVPCPRTWAATLTLLHHTLQTPSLPPSLWDFTGRGTGLAVLGCAFPGRGYTFYAALCVAAEAGRRQEAVASPRLFSFHGQDGVAWTELALHGGRLWLTTRTGPAGTAHQSVELTAGAPPLVPGRWHSVAVVHEHNRFQRSTVTLWLDGVAVGPQPLRYPTPKLAGTLYVATDYEGRSFRGQLGPVYLYREALPAPAGSAPDFFTEAAHVPKALCVLHPTRLWRGVCYDVEEDGDLRTLTDAAVLGAGATAHRATGVGRALQALGGVELLWPLLQRVAHSAVDPAEAGDGDAANLETGLLALIGVVRQALALHPGSQDWGRRPDAFARLATLLAPCPPAVLTPPLAEALVALDEVLSSEAALEGLYFQLLVAVFLRPSIPGPTVERLVEAILQRCATEQFMAWFREKGAVPLLLRVLLKPLPVLRSTAGLAFPRSESAAHLRKQILRLLFRLLCGSEGTGDSCCPLALQPSAAKRPPAALTAAEVDALLATLVHTADRPAECADVLQFLVELLMLDSPSAGSLRAALQAKGTYPAVLFPLLRGPAPAVRTLAVRCSLLCGARGAGTPSPKGDPLAALLAVLPDVLAAHPWSEAGHRALRGLLTGEGGAGVDGAFLGHARLAAAMLTMAAAPTSIRDRATVTQDILQWLSLHNTDLPATAPALQWPRRLLRLLRESPEIDPEWQQCETDVTLAARRELKAAVEAATKLVVCAGLRAPDGSAAMEDVVALLLPESLSRPTDPTFQTVPFLGALFAAAFHTVASSLTALPRACAPPPYFPHLTASFAHLTALLYDCLFAEVWALEEAVPPGMVEPYASISPAIQEAIVANANCYALLHDLQPAAPARSPEGAVSLPLKLLRLCLAYAIGLSAAAAKAPREAEGAEERSPQTAVQKRSQLEFAHQLLVRGLSRHSNPVMCATIERYILGKVKEVSDGLHRRVEPLRAVATLVPRLLQQVLMEEQALQDTSPELSLLSLRSRYAHAFAVAGRPSPVLLRSSALDNTAQPLLSHRLVRIVVWTLSGVMRALMAYVSAGPQSPPSSELTDLTYRYAAAEEQLTLDTCKSVSDLLLWVGMQVTHQQKPLLRVYFARLATESLRLADLPVPSPHSALWRFLNLFAEIWPTMSGTPLYDTEGVRASLTGHEQRQVMAALLYCDTLQHMEFDCTVAAQNGAPRWQRRLHELDEVERQGREAARQVLAGYEREMAETGQAVRLAVAADLHEHSTTVPAKWQEVHRSCAKWLQEVRDRLALTWWVDDTTQYAAPLPFQPGGRRLPPARQLSDVFWGLDRYETRHLRERCRLRRWKHGSRHAEACRELKGQAQSQYVAISAEEVQRVLAARRAEDEASSREEASDYAGSSSPSKFLEGNGRSDSSPNLFADALAPDPSLVVVPPPSLPPALKLEGSPQLLYIGECALVYIMDLVPGTLYITARQLYWVRADDATPSAATAGAKDFAVPLAHIAAVHHRRYYQQDTAVECFLRTSRSVLFAFETPEQKTEVLKLLMKRLNVAVVGSLTPRRRAAKVLAGSGVTERWVRREITTFEYLMTLNTIAGRTYCDLNQYPVFPWVLADYHSPTLDLSDGGVYRDLAKPIGACNSSRRPDVVRRYEQLQEAGMAPFHYGTHYSCGATVVYYLIRLEPFTTWALHLQGGCWDHADRLFHSVAEAWDNTMTNISDVKELIPEFFCCPDFLLNRHRLDMGRRQSGDLLGDVRLPPWARNAFDFVTINRMALESEYVSQHLHLWIDLIFGDKQRGQAALEHVNVFHPFTYEGGVDWAKVEDDLERTAIQEQIRSFGQTPAQLLLKPHPPRLKTIQTVGFNLSTASRTPTDPDPLNLPGDRPTSVLPHAGIGVAALFSPAIPELLQGHVLSVSSAGRLCLCTYSPAATPAAGCPTLSAGEEKPLPPGSVWTDRLTPRWSLPAGAALSPSQPYALFHGASPAPHVPSAILCSHGGKLLITAGYWDHSIRVSSVTRPHRVLDRAAGPHHDVVTCLAVDELGTRLASGGRDGLVVVWQLGTGATGRWLEGCLHVLLGHLQPVWQVEVSAALDLVVSGGQSGAVLLHSLETGRLLQLIRHPLHRPVQRLLLSPTWKALLVYSDDCTTSTGCPVSLLRPLLTAVEQEEGSLEQWNGSASLHYLTLSGDVIACVAVSGHVSSLVLSHNEQYLLVGGIGLLEVLGVHTLKPVFSFTLPRPPDQPTSHHTVTALAISPDGLFVFAGLKGGAVLAFPFGGADSTRARQVVSLL